MEKLLEKTKDKLIEEIEDIIKKPSISPAELEHLRKSFEVIENILRIECYIAGYSETASKNFYMGYSGHSTRDRIISKLEKMLDDEQSANGQQTIRDVLNIISRMSY